MGPLSNLRAKARDHYHSTRYRLLGRCWACHRRVLLHSPRRLQRCADEPLAILLPDPVVPVSHAEPA
jgi:hypothetical protein